MEGEKGGVENAGKGVCLLTVESFLGVLQLLFLLSDHPKSESEEETQT